MPDAIINFIRDWMNSKHAVGTYRVTMLLLLITAICLGTAAWRTAPAYINSKISENPTVKETSESVVAQGKAMVAALSEQTKTLADHDKRIALQEQFNAQSQELNKAIFGVVTDLRQRQQVTQQDTAAIKATIQEHGTQLERIERRLDSPK